MRVRLTKAGICGAQLRDEVEAAIGETLGALDVVYYPDTHEVELPDRLEAHRATIEAVVQAHVPDTSEQDARNATRKWVAGQLQSAVGLHISETDVQQKLALLAGIAFVVGAIDNTGQVRSPGEWLR